MQTLNPFEIAQKQLDKCAKILKLNPSIHKILRVPMREIRLTPAAGAGDAAGNGGRPGVGTLTVYDTSGPYTDPDVTALRQEMAELKREAEQRKVTEVNTQAATVTQEIEDFQKAVAEDGTTPLRPHFDAVRDDMSALIRVGGATSLRG